MGGGARKSWELSLIKIVRRRQGGIRSFLVRISERNQKVQFKGRGVVDSRSMTIKSFRAFKVFNLRKVGIKNDLNV